LLHLERRTFARLLSTFAVTTVRWRQRPELEVKLPVEARRRKDQRFRIRTAVSKKLTDSSVPGSDFRRLV